VLPSFVQPDRLSRRVLSSHHFQLTDPCSKSSRYTRTFIPAMTKMWNSLPCSCVYGASGDLIGLQAFKSEVNKWILSKR
jgi:hypothetical protein